MSASAYEVAVSRPKTLEDWLLFLTPIVAALAGFNWGGLVPGTAGFVVGVAIGSLAKTLIGLGRNPSLKNWEDVLSFAVTLLGFLGTAFSANSAFLTYGLILGLIVKALGFLKTGINVEDGLLALGALIAGIGALENDPSLLNAGLLLGLVGKSVPSIGTDGASGTPKIPA